MTGTLGWFLAIAAQAAAPAADTDEFVVRNEEPPFETKLPRGYAPVKDPRWGYVYQRKAGPADWERILVRISVGEGPISEGKTAAPADLAKPASIPAEATLSSLKQPWGEYTIDVVEGKFIRDSFPFYVRVAHVPLVPKSVALVVLAPELLQKEARADLNKAVQTLTGKSNWMTPREKANQKRAELTLYATLALSALYGASVLVLFRRQPMAAHFARTVALAVIALGFFIPTWLGHRWGIPALAGTLFFLSLAGRRLKMAVEEGD